MKLWLISQNANLGYDTYDSAVVAAATEEEARSTHPRSNRSWGERFPDWCETPEQVTAVLIGDALPGTGAGVICASFNAG